MKTLFKTIITISLLCIVTIAKADIAVIVHPSSTVSSLSNEEIKRIFLGKIQSFPNGKMAVPINQDVDSPVRQVFNKVVCKKSKSQYKAYWSKLLFTGKGTPPADVGDSIEVKQLVSQNPNFIGYVDASVVDNSVRVVFSIPSK